MTNEAREFAWSIDLGPSQPPDPSHPFAFVCPDCGADVDAEEPNFLIACGALIPHSEFMLIELHCVSCSLVSDVCLWPFLAELLSKGDDHGDKEVENHTPDTVALLDRYYRQVEESRQEWEALYTRQCYLEPGLHKIDLMREHVVPTTRRLTAIASRVLAAARGCRKAVATHPRLDPAGLLEVGSFKCGLSLDVIPGGSQPYALHLSVSGNLGLGKLSPFEQAFLVSLFFTREERPHLWSKEGETNRSVTHFYLGCVSPDVTVC